MAAVKKYQLAEPLNIQATIMAIREEVMRYYKDTCIERVTSNRNVNRRYLGDYINDRPPYQYQRELRQRQDAQLLLIGQFPIAVLRKQPDQLMYVKHVLKMSPGLKQVDEGLHDLIERYLRGVVTSDNKGKTIAEGVVYQIPPFVSDKELFTTEPRVDNIDLPGFIRFEGHALSWDADPTEGQYITYTSTSNAHPPVRVNSPRPLTEEELNQYMGMSGHQVQGINYE